MLRGTVSFTDGSTVSCEYDLSGPDGGTLRLPEMFFTAHRETVHDATLELEDKSQRMVNIVLGPRVGEATFTFVE